MSGEYRIDASISFDDPRTAFYLSFPRTDVLVDSGVTVIWRTGSGDIEKNLDTEDLDMFTYETELFSFPWITSGRRHVDLSLISRSPLSPEKIALLTSYSE